MADDVDSEVLQVVNRQLRQHRVVDFVFAECCLVSRQAEAPKPNPHIHRRFLRPSRFDDGLTPPRCP